VKDVCECVRYRQQRGQQLRRNSTFHGTLNVNYFALKHSISRFFFPPPKKSKEEIFVCLKNSCMLIIFMTVIPTQWMSISRYTYAELLAHLCSSLRVKLGLFGCYEHKKRQREKDFLFFTIMLFFTEIKRGENSYPKNTRNNCIHLHIFLRLTVLYINF
jgi:hypothetical protein